MKISINMGPTAAAVIRAMPRKETSQRILAGIGPAAFAAWVTFAQNQLRSTSRTYIQGLQMEPGEMIWKIHLVGQMPNMVEQGWAGGDMRRWMLKSPKAKMGANGPYLDIPFRHGTAGTSGRNVGTSMPAAINRAAAKLSPTFPGQPASVATGMRRLMAGGPGISKQANTILNTVTKPHTASIYQGMVRNATMTPKGPKTSGYMTFRRISAKGNPASWQHGGIKPHRLAEQVQKYVNLIAKAKIAEALK